MNNLLKFISKYHIGFIFLFLELFSSLLIIQNDRYYKAGFLNSANSLSGTVYSFSKNLSIYIGLKENNLKLAEENALLRNKLRSIEYTLIPPFVKDTLNTDTLIIDTLSKFNYIPALAIRNSINKKHNQIYLDKGTKDGIYNNMGVIESKGLVGIIVNTTKYYSIVMPLINEKSRISVKVKNKGYFGTLEWERGDFNIAQVKEIPNHATISKGDTIISSGYSQIFPRGILVGIVSNTEKIEGSSFLKVELSLAVDFSKINYVYTIENKELELFNEIIIE